MTPLRGRDGRTIPPMVLDRPLQRRITALACHRPGTAKRRTKMPPAPASSAPGGSNAVAYKPVPDEP